MNEPASPRWTDTTSLPPPTIYDPAEDDAPPFGAATLPPVVLLLVGEADRDWAGRTAIELSAAWAAAGNRVVLADFHLENPILAAELGGHGLEGVVDIFVYGASLARIIRPVEGRGFQFIPTGTYTADAGALFRHSRWPRLVADFRDSGATLVIFAAADAADLGSLAVWVNQALLLGPPREASMLTPLTLSGTEIRGMIVAPRGEGTAPPPIPAIPHRLRYPVTTRASDEEDALHLPPPPVRVPHPGHRAAVLLLWVLLGAALITAVGYTVASIRPDLVPWASVRTAGDSVGATLQGPTGPRALGEPLPFSVQVIAFQNFDAAHDQLLQLRQQVPGVLFFVSPEEIQGILYFRVLAGALPDVDVARQIRDVLVASEAIEADEAAGDWSRIQETRFSFIIGDAPNRAAANAAVDSLMERRVPAYPVAVPYSDGTLHWHLYAGAFPDSASAVSLFEQLTAAGLQPKLTARFGSPASPEL
jgi:hypothetical protein